MNKLEFYDNQHFYINDYLVDIPYLKQEVTKLASGTIVHNAGISILTLENYGILLGKGRTVDPYKVLERLAILRMYGVKIPNDIVNL